MSNNYFALFGLEPSMSIDLAMLEQSYYKKAKEAHPDFSEGEQDAVAILNSAFETLSDPIKRLWHLLAQRGEDLSDHNLAIELAKIDGLLDEMMEYNERIAEFPADIDLIMEEIGHKITHELENLKEPLLPAAIRLRYYHRFIQDSCQGDE